MALDTVQMMLSSENLQKHCWRLPCSHLGILRKTEKMGLREMNTEKCREYLRNNEKL